VLSPPRTDSSAIALPPASTDRSRVRVPNGIDAILVVAGSLLAFYLLPVFLTGARLPFGSDASYYVWMTRFAEHAGLGATGFRAGAHALLAATSAGSPLDLLQSIAPLDVALEVALGLAAAALVSFVLGHRRARFVVVGIVTGAYASRMATGYLANLLFMVLFLAALALLLMDRRRVTLALGTAMLVGAGLAHGPFLALGVAVLGGALALGRVRRAVDPAAWRVEEGRIVVAVGATLVVLAGLMVTGVLTVAGSQVLHSGDAILRTLGLGSLLHAQYRQRFPGSVAAAGLVATVPLAAWGAWFAGRSGRTIARAPRLLVMSWVVVTGAGVALGLLTGWFPPGRVLGVAMWLPGLAAIGVLGIGASLNRTPAVRFALAAVLVLGLLVAPLRSLSHSNVNASPAELHAVMAAGRWAVSLPPGTPLVYLVDPDGSNPAFQASRMENVTRMGLPADRMTDVFLFLGGREDLAAGKPRVTGDAVYNDVSQLYARRAAPALARAHAVFLLAPFDQRDWGRAAGLGRAIGPNAVVLSSPVRLTTGAAAPTLRRISPVARLLYSVLFLLAFFAVGWVCMRSLRRRDVAALALAPAVGTGVVTLIGVAVLLVR
jgi:hypothetical protein